MKTRHSPNLYELLKQSTPKASPAEPAAAPAAETAPSSAELERTLESDGSPSRPPEPAPAPVRTHTTLLPANPPATRIVRSSGPGERILKMSYNTAAFTALVIVGMVFLSYAFGMRVGRGSTPAQEPVATHAPLSVAPAMTVAPAPPPPKPVSYTIRLMEWPAKTSKQNSDALYRAGVLKKELEKRQLGQGEIQSVGSGDARRVVLVYGRFTDANVRDAQQKLALLREFRIRTTEPPVFKQASLVAVP